MKRFGMLLVVLTMLCVMVGASSAWAVTLLEDQFNAPNGTALDATKWTANEVNDYTYTQQNGLAAATVSGGFRSIDVFGSDTATITWEALGVTFGSDLSGRARIGLFARRPGGIYEGVHYGTHGSGTLLACLTDTWGTGYAITAGAAYDLKMDWTPGTNSIICWAKASSEGTWTNLLELHNNTESVPGTGTQFQFNVDGGSSLPSIDSIRVYDNSVVPEPASCLTMMVGGFSVLGYAIRRRR